MSIFAPVSYMEQKVEEAPAGPQYQLRSDSYSSYIKLALPGALFTDIGMSNYYDDVHADILGSGTNYTTTPTGSASEFAQYTASAFTDYPDEAIYNKDGGCWGALSSTELPFGSDDWVVEGWVIMDEAFNRPPYWKVFLRNNNYYIDCDFGQLNLMRVVYETDTESQTQRFTSKGSSPLGVWKHYAFVRSGTSLYTYFDGNRVLNSSITGAIKTPGFIRILAGENATNDGAAGAWQDVRVYIGTDKGYTGATITPPDSMVEKIT